MEDLRKVWEATEMDWWIMANNELLVKRIIIRVDGLEEDWEEVLEDWRALKRKGKSMTVLRKLRMMKRVKTATWNSEKEVGRKWVVCTGR